MRFIKGFFAWVVAGFLLVLIWSASPIAGAAQETAGNYELAELHTTITANASQALWWAWIIMWAFVVFASTVSSEK